MGKNFEQTIKEFIDSDLDYIQGSENDFRADKTITGVAKQDGQAPATTDDFVDQAKQDWWHTYFRGGGWGTHVIGEDLVKRINIEDLSELYEEDILLKTLKDLIETLQTVEKTHSKEQYRDILKIVFLKIKEIYDLEGQTISDSKNNT